MRPIVALTIALAALAASPNTLAQAFPSKPVHIFVGVPPPAAPDIVARLFAKELEKELGQPFVVENRVGANSTLAAKAVVGAAPDGYTLFLGSPINISPVFLRNNAVDAGKELSPISRVYTSPFMVFVTAKQPFKSWGDIVSYAKANPGKANFGTVASLTTLLMSVLKTRSDINYTVVPYKANADLIKAMTVGDVDFTVLTPPPFLSSIQAGTVRPLFGTQRFALLPNVPAAADVGIANFDLVTNGGIWAPRDTPADVVQKLSASVAKAAKAPEIVEPSRKNFGLDIVSTTPAEEMRNFEKEMRFWQDAARAAKFEPE